MRVRSFLLRHCMFLISACLVTFVLLHGQVIRSQEGSAEEAVIVLSGGTLIDGTGASPRSDIEVVIRGNQIAAVGTKGSLTYPSSARVIATDNKYILPGLIDSHVHYDDWVAELFLYYGVTTVVDLGNFGHWILEMRRQIDSGKIVGPRIFAAGNSINRVPIQGPGVQHQLGVRTPEQAADVARKLIQQGVNLFKIYARMTPEMIAAVAAVAHTRNIRVHAHIGIINAAEAARSGVDVLEHASGVAEATAPPDELAAFLSRGLRNAENLMDPARYDSLIRTLIAEEVFITPTLLAYGFGVHPRVEDYRRFDLEFLRNPDVRYFPPNPIKRVHARLMHTPERNGHVCRLPLVPQALTCRGDNTAEALDCCADNNPWRRAPVGHDLEQMGPPGPAAGVDALTTPARRRDS